ncbi:Protein-lysine N-methyltransferase efm6 [Emydomyces testavorans]|uniref:Protein-lysine N-methyltransferase EFM6 n=1 Tax=Emydomyces testavorans TaxID=2070801 RepID=A0AAF0DG57_9EURO|nr:Protein-lysine N-methyltransferase efm6 [Emydomyces testavorans]
MDHDGHSIPDATSSNPEELAISESLVPTREIKMATTLQFTFDGLLDPPLQLKEDPKEGCGGHIWPAGMVLAKYMLRTHRSDLLGKRIVELGAGSGLVGLAVARGCKIDSPVYVTDQTPMLALIEENIALNELSGSAIAALLDWGDSSALSTLPSHPEVILAADCVYFEPAFPLLVSTLDKLMGKNSVCYFCFKKRRKADIRFIKMARKIFEITEVIEGIDHVACKHQGIFLYILKSKPRQSPSKNGKSSDTP